MELISIKEKKVLGALFHLGTSPISKIAAETLVNRTALYHTLELLIQRGLVTRTIKEKASYFQPVSLEEYRTWSKQQIASLAKQTDELGDWLSQKHSSSPSLQTDIRYFEGLEGIKHLYADSWRDNKEKKIYAITDYDQAYTALNNFLEKEYFPDRIANKVAVKSLLPPTQRGLKDLARADALLRDMRFIEIFKKLGIEINIYGDKVSIIAFDKKKPSGLLIKNPIIATAFKDIFTYLWDTASHPNK